MIVCEDLVIGIDKNKTFTKLNTALMPGQWLSIIGPSGSGKSTFIRTIAGLALPIAGRLYIGGQLANDPQIILSPRQRNIGWLSQDANLWPHMSARENIAFPLLSHLSRQQALQSADKLLCDADLAALANSYPHQLSGGQARQIALLRAVSAHPPLLLFDEPFANIDDDTTKKLAAMIKTIAAAYSPTVICAAHHLADCQMGIDYSVNIELPTLQ